MKLHQSVKSVDPDTQHIRNMPLSDIFSFVCFSSFDSSHDVSEGIPTGLNEAFGVLSCWTDFKGKVYDVNPQIRCT